MGMGEYIQGPSERGCCFPLGLALSPATGVWRSWAEEGSLVLPEAFHQPKREHEIIPLSQVPSSHRDPGSRAGLGCSPDHKTTPSEDDHFQKRRWETRILTCNYTIHSCEEGMD